MVALSTPVLAAPVQQQPRTINDMLASVRPYLERLLGWDQRDAVSSALESIAAFLDGKAQLSVVGHIDLAPVGESIHYATLGRVPFVVLDRRRKSGDGDIRSPACRHTVPDAIRAARGGTVFIRGERFTYRLEHWRDLAPDVRVMVHTAMAHTVNTVRPRPVAIDDLTSRSGADLARIVAETVADVQAALDVTVDLPAEHREWVARTCQTLHDVEKAVARLLASLSCRTATGAAEMLGCEAISLRRWLTRAGFAWPPLVPPELEG